ncbi:MAG TPA: hypothetical protein VIY98_05935 [Nitrososphaeraceae archaeon]
MSELDQFYNNSSLSTDFYELTMASACFSSHQNDKVSIFELFVASRASFYLLEFLQSRIKRNHMKSNKKIVKM